MLVTFWIDGNAIKTFFWKILSTKCFVPAKKKFKSVPCRQNFFFNPSRVGKKILNPCRADRKPARDEPWLEIFEKYGEDTNFFVKINRQFFEPKEG